MIAHHVYWTKELSFAEGLRVLDTLFCLADSIGALCLLE